MTNLVILDDVEKHMFMFKHFYTMIDTIDVYTCVWKELYTYAPMYI